MPTAEFREAVRTNVLETVLGLVLVVTGGGLAFAPGFGVRFGGYVVSTAGTILVSWALTRAWVSRQHHQELTRSLQAITRPLSTVASQLNYAVHQSQSSGDNDIDAHLVSSAVQHVFGVLTDLQGLIGSPISVAEIIAVKNRLEELGEELAAVEAPEVAESPEEVIELKQRVTDEINSIRLQLESAVAKKDRKYQNEAVLCPRCRTLTTVTLGSLPGDSGLHTCPACSSRFHVHRGADGNAFTKLFGGGPSLTIEVSCPECENKVPLNLPTGSDLSQQRYCLKCYTKLAVDPKTQTATIAAQPQQPLTGTLSADKFRIVCPDCSRSCATIYGRDGVYFAVCPVHDRLLRAENQPANNSPKLQVNSPEGHGSHAI